MLLRRYWTTACETCAIRHSCTPGKERLISRWEHEAVLETVQVRLDQHPEKMTMRRQTAEHPFGTIKCWMGATHFLTKRLPKVATEYGAQCARLQHQARDGDHRRGWAAGGLGRLSRGVLRVQINASRRPGGVSGWSESRFAQIGAP